MPVMVLAVIETEGLSNACNGAGMIETEGLSNACNGAGMI